MFHPRVRLAAPVNLEQLAQLPWDFQVEFGYQPPVENVATRPPDIGVTPPGSGSPANINQQTDGPEKDSHAAVKRVSRERYAELYRLLTAGSGVVSAFTPHICGQTKKNELLQVPDI